MVRLPCEPFSAVELIGLAQGINPACDTCLLSHMLRFLVLATLYSGVDERLTHASREDGRLTRSLYCCTRRPI